MATTKIWKITGNMYAAIPKVIDYAKNLKNPVIYDLCSGSGCIGISIAKAVPEAVVYCIEKSDDAFYYLEKNAKGVSNVNIIHGDINDSFDIEPADIIVSNPPYIKSDDISSLQSEVLFEPEMALDGGTDGFDFYRIINDKWADKLKPSGMLFLEIGNEQGDGIKSVLTSFCDIRVVKDIYKNDRIVIAKPLDRNL